MKEIKDKYLIVGQGLAGSILAFLLRKNKIPFKIIDNAHHQASSKVAAGIFNPMVFMRYAESWLAPELIPTMEELIQEIEILLNEKLIHHLPMKKIFPNEEDKRFWIQKSESRPFLGGVEENTKEGSMIMPFGYGIVKKTGYVDLEKLLDGLKNIFQKEETLINEVFDYEKIEFENELVFYKGIPYEGIIFCEGYQVMKNPFFNKLPYKHTKGEVLDINTSEEIDKSCIYNKKMFMLPTSNNNFKIGSTYDWNNLDFEKTNEAIDFLTEKLAVFFEGKYTIAQHKVGIRPTMKDRRPVIGNHPEYKNLYIFNGWGSKGVLLIPYFAKQMLAFLNSDDYEKLHPEVRLNRF